MTRQVPSAGSQVFSDRAGRIATPRFGHTALDFGWAVAGAVLIGALVGWATAVLRQRLDDPVLNTTISFAVPFLAYFPAEELHASGVLAVVLAGLLTGALGSKRFSARDRQMQATTWTTISFIRESAVFLAMGYQLPEIVDAALAETTVGELTGLVLLVVGLLVVLRFAGLVWPALRERFGRSDRNEQTRVRLGQFKEQLDSMTPADQREENRVAWARRRLARGHGDVEFEVSTMKERIVPRIVAGSGQWRNTRPDTHEQSLIVQRRYIDAMREALGTERSIGAYSSETYRQVEALLDVIEQRFGAS